MRVAYYKREDGTIRYFHSVDKLDAEELKKRVNEYNSKTSGEKVYVVEYKNDSFEAHLFQKATAKSKMDVNNLKELQYAIDDAYDILQGLIIQAEEAARGKGG